MCSKIYGICVERLHGSLFILTLILSESDWGESLILFVFFGQGELYSVRMVYQKDSYMHQLKDPSALQKP